MNEFDHFVKKTLKIKYYGRYVDDFILIHQGKNYLKSLIPIMTQYLSEYLKLKLHPNKIYLQHYTKGVKYLGTIILPHRIYIGNRTKGNFYAAIQEQNELIRTRKPDKEELAYFASLVNSYLGIFKHYRTFNIRKKFIKKEISAWWWNYFYVTKSLDKIVLK
ncbi:MAG: reverse transcriptase domain-containing protein [Chitinophagales bacterium]|nr:reverse transcriptase domain-containing protein [Chitinophagales bacterium]